MSKTYKYALNLEPKTNRILSACVVLKFTPADMSRVNELPEGDVTDYLYIKGEYIYDPLPKEESTD